MKGILKLLLINAIPLLLAVALAVDLFSAIGSTSTYPFGSDFFPSTSIYRSKAIYCAYNLVTIFLLLLLLPLSYRGRWKWYFIILAVASIMFVAPMLATE